MGEMPLRRAFSARLRPGGERPQLGPRDLAATLVAVLCALLIGALAAPQPARAQVTVVPEQALKRLLVQPIRLAPLERDADEAVAGLYAPSPDTPSPDALGPDDTPSPETEPEGRARELAFAGLVMPAIRLGPVRRADEAALTSVLYELDPLAVLERPIEDELILELRFGRYILSDGLIGYAHRGGVLLPLDEIARALEFVIDVDSAAGQAEGWFLSENRRFSLDVAKAEAFVEGRPAPFTRELIALQVDDIYVDTTLLSKWFPVDLEFDFSQLLVTVASREPLPLEQRLEREGYRARLGRGGLEQPDYPRVETPYQPLGWPAVDISLSSRYDSESGTNSRYDTRLSGDLLYMNTTLFAAGDEDDSLTDLRLLLERKDPDGELLGPLALTQISLGDTFTPQVPLVTSSGAGRGAVISSFPLNRPTEFDRITLRGELPLDWEVELYRNEVLLDFQVARGDGRYEFIDVPLLFGLNVLRLVFYGPQGQRREEIQRTFVGPGMITPGEQNFRVAANQQDRDLFSVNDDDNAGIDDEVEGRTRVIAEYERGLSNAVSLSGSLASVPLQAERRHYASVGLRAAVLDTFSRLDVSRDDQGGNAVQASSQTRVLGLNLFAEHAQFFDFVSERDDNETDPLDRRTTVRLDAVVPEGVLPRIPIGLTGTLEHRESGREAIDVSNRLSMAAGGVLGSNTVNVQIDRGGGFDSTTTADGSFLLNGRAGAVSLRGQLDYSISPDPALDSTTGTVDWFVEQDFNARFGVTKDLSGAGLTTLNAGVNRRFEELSVGLNGDYSDDGEFGIGLSASFSLSREPRGGSIYMLSRPAAQSGAVSARAFLDENQNGTFDEGETPLEGVQFRGARDVKTDAEGVGFIPSLSSYRPTAVAVDIGSLEDPYWVPSQEGAEVVPRPGQAALVDFAVVPTGEIDGVVYLQKGAVLREASNVAVQLLGVDGELIDEVKSQFDGFYLFEFVRPGRYTVQISPEQAARLSLAPSQGVEVNIDVVEGEASIESGIDFTIERARRGGDEVRAPPSEDPRAAPDTALPAPSSVPQLLPLASVEGDALAMRGAVQGAVSSL